MPEISRFFGIIIYMYAGDHNPPHLHAKYSGQIALLEIKTGKVIRGELSKTALQLVREWMELHQEELLNNFDKLKANRVDWEKVDPLK